MNKYELNPGEIIKIGRITMRIRDIKFKNSNTKNNNIANTSNDKNENENNNITNNNIIETENNNKKMTRLETTEDKTLRLNNKNKYNPKMNKTVKNIFNETKKNAKKKTQKDIFSKLEKMKRVCRICYLEEDINNPDNPLVQPCICSGSMKFIHLTCLRKWVSTRSCVRIDTTPDCSIFLIKPVICELCKTKFPDFIKYENRLFPVIDFSQEFENYLTLESLTLDRQNNKFIYVIALNDNKKIKIGRGHEAKVILSDISVSRIHCIMTVVNHKVFLEDNDSKFGTLILVQTPSLKLSENIPLYIQVGRSFFECKLIKQFKILNCCEAEDKNDLYYYYNQNEKFIKDHLGMVIKSDLSDFDDDSINNDNLINNTFEQKIKSNIKEEYRLLKNNLEEKLLNIEFGDKMSDNEYLLLKHNKEKKNIKKEIIYNDTEEDKKDNNNDQNNNNRDNNNGNDGYNNDDFDDENNEDNITASLNDEDERSSESKENNGN